MCGVVKFSVVLFFFQAEDGIRDYKVTGVQTCALPILRENTALDVDQLRVKCAVVNEGPTLKRFTPAAMGRATPIKKRTSHVEIHVEGDAESRAPKTTPAKAGAKAEVVAKGKRPKAAKKKKAAAAKTKKKAGK